MRGKKLYSYYEPGQVFVSLIKPNLSSRDATAWFWTRETFETHSLQPGLKSRFQDRFDDFTFMHLLKAFMPIVQAPAPPNDRFDIELPAGK